MSELNHIPKDKKPEANATDSVVLRQTFRKDQYIALMKAKKDYGLTSDQELIRFIVNAFLRQYKYIQ